MTPEEDPDNDFDWDEGLDQEEGEQPVGDVVVDGDADRPTIRLQTHEINLLLKTSPRIAASDAAFVVKRDGSSASCCAASLSLASPSLSFPTNALHDFSPLLFFDDGLERGAVDLLSDTSPHEIVVVGAPDSPESARQLLESLFDPRREILWLVDDTEFGRATAAVDALQARLRAIPGARFLLRTASSVSFAYQPGDQVQIFQIPRARVAAAAQIVLDLAALRRHDPESIPLVVDGKVTYLNSVGNVFGQRQLATRFGGIAGWEELMERYEALRREGLGKLRLASSSFDEHHLSAILPQLTRRPVLVFPESTSLTIASIPYARHLGAIMLPLDEDTASLLASLSPADVYAPEQDLDRLPAGDWALHPLPETAAGLARRFQALVAEDHRTLLDGLESSFPHLLGSRELLEEMAPSEYLVLGLDRESEKEWSYIAANYAAALKAPLLLADTTDDYVWQEISEHGESLLSLRYDFTPAPRPSPQAPNGDEDAGLDNRRQLYRRIYFGESKRPSPKLRASLAGIFSSLSGLNPRYIGFISSLASFPIELVGEPPLATRFAIGRLSGPDLSSTSLLVSRAALSEDRVRPTAIRAVLAECADTVPGKTLPNAQSEVAVLRDLLASQPDVDTTLIAEANDRTRFQAELGGAGVVHFAGHGHFDEVQPERSGLVFREGVLTPSDLRSTLDAAPSFFATPARADCSHRAPRSAAAGAGQALPRRSSTVGR